MGKNDIDDIFATKKPKVQEESKTAKTTKGNPDATVSTNANKKRNTASKSEPKVDQALKKQVPMPSDDLFTDLKGSKRRKTTEEGFRVYDDEELKIDPNAGNTDECPFDCSCCY
ncbi:Uncharacterized protein C6G9.01c [Taphrina deformans PYCC 5710]|uniref:Uncharacterized protein C6G9.01c n=1 Tax=Taphrina deformans (strain PYCC 5710 / ATCC 11124 / CBS 356.35 / IMI 108563 / JCM 9778 / NBRC 8474) TaxID=1097556 RepID=R4X8L7_TAPDE|nr:Uncharacterized protein C6G9.01c [Taphrina deformans PYCC 5710]|eukprot:CCG81963.1 Uncharacterized protein C6G9.01c [Taphrina deformans PYCC 5710]